MSIRQTRLQKQNEAKNYFLKMEKKDTTPTKRKLNASESQAETSVTPKKKRMLKLVAEEMDISEIQNTTASTSILELTDQNLTVPDNLEKSIEIKTERGVDEEYHVSNNDAEENWVDSKASVSILAALSDRIDEEKSLKKKKKKKKHKELDDTAEVSILEDTMQENLVEDVNENPIEEMPVKKKKKKKSSKKDQFDESLKEVAQEAIQEAPEEAPEETDEYIKSNQENGEVSEEEINSELSFLDTKRMFQDILQKLMADKNMTNRIFWANYKFHPYSSKNCRIAFEKILTKVQKKRTLFELVNAATTMMTDSPKVFSDVKQKKPTTPFKLFSQIHYRKISRKHPEYRGIQILNKLTKKWAKLSDQKKLKYIDRALSHRDEYLEMVRNFQKIDSSFIPKPILSKAEWQLKDRCAGLPDVPARNALLLFIQKSGDLYSDLPNQVRIKKLSADFKMLPAEVKKKYSQQVKEDRSDYDAALKVYLENLSESEREDRDYTFNYKANPVISKPKKINPVSEKSEISESVSLAQKPPVSGYMLFYKELKTALKYVPLIKKHVIVSEKWKALSEEQRNEYKKRRVDLQNAWLQKQNYTLEEITQSHNDDDEVLEELVH